MTTPTQIRIDSDIKTQANKIFALLGLDMSSAVNLFLHQCVIRGGLPFNVEIPNYNAETLAAIEEAKQISGDANVPGFKTVEELKKALEDND